MSETMQRLTRSSEPDGKIPQAAQVQQDSHAADTTRAIHRTATSSLGITRRGFLLSSAVMGALAVMNLPRIVPLAYGAEASDAVSGTGVAAAGTSAAAPATTAADFVRLSAFLTSRDTLDVTSAARFLTSLSKHDAAFNGKVAALLAYIDAQKFPHMDDFLVAAKDNAPQMATATSIVSAWYLGIVGAASEAELITYESALMYAPTKGILAVPTYGPGPLAWGDTPAGAGISDRPATPPHA